MVLAENRNSNLKCNDLITIVERLPVELIDFIVIEWLTIIAYRGDKFSRVVCYPAEVCEDFRGLSSRLLSHH